MGEHADEAVDRMSDPDKPARIARKATVKRTKTKRSPVTTATPDAPAQAVDSTSCGPECDDLSGAAATAQHKAAEDPAPAEPQEVADEPPVAPGTAMAVGTSMAVGSISSRIRYAKELSESGLLPAEYRKNPANVLFAVEYGLMLGIHPMSAITGIHVIDGKPSASAALMSALVRDAGHRLRVSVTGTVEGGDLKATARLTRKDDPDFTFEAVWTIDRAVRAELVESYRQGTDGKWVLKATTGSRGKAGNWQKYPEAMAKARAISEVVREACEEVLCGVRYTPEELGAMVNEDGNVIDGTVVSETLAAPAEEVIPPLSADATAAMRAATFAAFDAPDPREPLATIWRETGPAMEVTMVADWTGEVVTVKRFLTRAMALLRSNMRPVDGQAQPVKMDAPQAAPETAQDDDGIEEAVLVPEGQDTAVTTAVQVLQDGGLINDDPDGTGHPHGDGDGRDVDDQEPPHDPEAEAALAQGSAPLVPETVAEPDDAIKRQWLLDEMEVQAAMLESTVAALTMRERRSKKREVNAWTNDEILAFVGQWRGPVAMKYREAGKHSIGAVLDGLPKTAIIDLKAMLAEQ